MTDKCDTFVARWDHAMCSTCGEEHDRPAPTPTATPGLDLEAIERAERAMTPRRPPRSRPRADHADTVPAPGDACRRAEEDRRGARPTARLTEGECA